jgi:galactitol-specific phosphotransferase system IIB component
MRHALLASLLLLAACGGAAPSSTTTTTAAAAATQDPDCPVEVAGTSVAVEDTGRGAALVFVTTGDVVELRARLARVAEAHNARHAAMGPLPSEADVASDDGGHHHHHHGGGDGGHGGGHGGAGGSGLAGMIGSHSRAAVEEIEGGARLVMVSMAGQEQALRDELRMHAGHLEAGTCGMGHP